MPTLPLRLLACTALATAFGCHALEGTFPGEGTALLKPQEVAAAAQLTGLAFEPIPLALRTGARVHSLQIVGDTLYVVDDSAMAHAIDVARGTHRWVLQLQNLPDRPIAVGSQYVGFLSRNHLLVASRSSGSRLSQVDLDFTPSSGAVLTLDTLYAGSWGSGFRLRSVNLADGWDGWSYTADGPVTGTPALAGSGADQMVYFASHDGKVIAVAPTPAAGTAPKEPIWTATTLGKNSADLAVAGDSLYVASEDHALHALNRRSGEVRWKWSKANTALTDAPQVIGDVLYQRFGGSVAALRAEDGAEIYRRAGAERFVTRIGDRDVLALVDGGLAVVDASTGAEIAVVESPLLLMVPTNAAGGTLVFSDGKNIYGLK